MSEIVKASAMAAAIEQVVIGGDLSKLNAEQRVTYVRNVCDSLGLNPTTKPFEYIVLNGKLTLYATRAASEQLRKIHGVSIFPLERTLMAEAGLYQVVARGRDGTGREDEASGVVTISGLKGENLANAMLKCETKAKRRLTLSICGLGFLDETEVSDIPGAQAPAAAPAAALPKATESTNAAISRLRAKVEEAGIMVSKVEVVDAVASDPAPAPTAKTTNPRKGGGAPVTPIPARAPASEEGDGEYLRVKLKYVDVKETKGGKPYISVKTYDNQQFNCWNDDLHESLLGAKDKEIMLLVEYPPEGAPAAARPKITELRLVEAQAAAEPEVPEDLPF